VDGVGMDERDLEAEEAGARLLVDELRAVLGQVAESGRERAAGRSSTS
jgi:hypothetical protein